MRRRAFAVAAFAALALAGCGGALAQTDEQQIKAVETQIAGDIASGHLAATCRYATDPRSCALAVTAAKTLEVDTAALIPSDYRNEIANATVTVSGEHASMVWGGRTERFVKVDGHWLNDNQ